MQGYPWVAVFVYLLPMILPVWTRRLNPSVPQLPRVKKYVLAIDEGTTSTRSILFDDQGNPAFTCQKEFTQYYPNPGWAEHDPEEILDSVQETIADVMSESGVEAQHIAAVGITNQRETTVAWDRESGKPLHNAIVWLDVRTAEITERLKADGGLDRFRQAVGLPVSTYFSAVKMMWLIENIPAVKEAVEQGRCLFGTIDSWLTYHLTGGKEAGIHVTDVTNAARYMLMNLHNLNWDEDICQELGIPISSLPEIKSNSEVLGEIKSGVLAGVPIASSIGDQHAALLGQGCLGVADVKSTYGTGTFIVMNTGRCPVPSAQGLLTTIGYKLGESEPTVYALEGAVATAGRGVQWLRDSLKLIDSAPDINSLAGSVVDTGGVTFVPAFSGLLAPHWRPDARASILGISLYTTDAHIARAMLEGIAFQASDVMTAMLLDADVEELATLKVDGGLTKSDLAMQMQANLLGKPLLRARMPEATALGAAFAAGLAVGFWNEPNDIFEILAKAGGTDKFEPLMDKATREAANERWQSAVESCLAGCPVPE